MNDIEVLIKRLGYIEESYLNNHYMSIGNFKDIDEAINLLKERQSDKERIKDLEEINEAHKKENGELREIIKELEGKLNQLFTARRYGKTIELAMQLREELLKLPKCKLYGIKQCKNKVILVTKEEVIPKSLIKEKIEEIDKWLDKGKYADYGMNPYELKAQKQVLEELLKGE